MTAANDVDRVAKRYGASSAGRRAAQRRAASFSPAGPTGGKTTLIRYLPGHLATDGSRASWHDVVSDSGNRRSLGVVPRSSSSIIIHRARNAHHTVGYYGLRNNRAG